MDQRYFKQIVLIGTLVFYTCISIPEVPNNGFERCIAHYYNVKRRMREIQIQNKNFTTVIVSVSFGVGFWVGPIGFVPLIVLPYTQYRNKKKTDVIREEWEKEYCTNSSEAPIENSK